MESTVNFNTKLKEAASFGQPITEYDPGSRGYKDFVNLARELMGHRPAVMEQPTPEPLSRPAELVQRAKQLAQLANFQFGRTSNIGQMPRVAEPPFRGTTLPRPEPVRNAATLSRVAELGFDEPEPNFRSIATTRPVDRHDGCRTAPDDVHHDGTGRSRPRQSPPGQTTAEKIDAFYGVRQVGDQRHLRRPVRRRQPRADRRRFQQLVGDVDPDVGRRSHQPLGHEAAVEPGPVPIPLRRRRPVDHRPGQRVVEANQFGELNNVVEVR